MPWEVRKTGSKFSVFKKGGARPLGSHATRAKANAQVRALYASEPTARPKAATRRRMVKKASSRARQYAVSKRK